MTIPIAISIILAANTVSFVILLVLKKRREDGERETSIPVSTLFGVLIFGILGHATGLILLREPMWDSVWGTTGSGVITGGNAVSAVMMLAVMVVPALPPLILFVNLLLDRISGTSVSHIMGLNTAKAPETDFSRARSLKVTGHVEEALAEYRAIYREHPASERPLFEIHRVLLGEGRHEEAAAVLRQIARDFRDQDLVWARATTELANHLQNEAGNHPAAAVALEQVVKRVPQTDYGRVARARLSDLAPTRNSSQGGHGSDN